MTEGRFPSNSSEEAKMQVSDNKGTERGLYPQNTPPGVRFMLNS